MSFILKGIYEGFTYRKGKKAFHPLTSLVILSIQFLSMILADMPVLLCIAAILIVEAFLARTVRENVAAVKAVVPIASIAFLSITFFYMNIQHSFTVFLRIILGALAFSTFAVTTNLSDIARSLERIGVPPRFSQVPVVAFRVIPSVISDTLNTHLALRLRRELGTRFSIKNMIKMVAVIVASSLYRAESIAEALYLKGFGAKRSHFYTYKVSLGDLSRMIMWLLVFLLIILNKTNYLVLSIF